MTGLPSEGQVGGVNDRLDESMQNRAAKGQILVAADKRVGRILSTRPGAIWSDVQQDTIQTKEDYALLVESLVHLQQLDALILLDAVPRRRVVL